jgi:hypothetical protein
MQKILLLLIFNLVCFFQASSQVIKDTSVIIQKNDTLEVEKTYQLTDGTFISSAELDAIFERAWEKSFRRMTDEETKLLFENVNVEVKIDD